MKIFFYNYNKISLIYFIFLIRINIINNECDRNNAFKLYNEECSYSCFKYTTLNYDCILDNSIIKEQYLNNIIFLGEKGKPYFNFLSFTNGVFFLKHILLTIQSYFMD